MELVKEIEKTIKKRLYSKKYPEAWEDWEELNSVFGLTEIILKVVGKTFLKEIKILKAKNNPYSKKIFPEPTKKQWRKRNKLLEENNLSPDQFSGSLCRLGWNNALHDVEMFIKNVIKEVG